MIGGGLNTYNDEVAEHADRQPLAVLIKDPATGNVLGGTAGRSSLGLLFLDLFYRPTALRGFGLGTKVLRAFEDERQRRGCVAGVLYTISLQSPAFYERHGWRAVWGNLMRAARNQQDLSDEAASDVRGSKSRS